jgi:hypothetical protein
VGLVVETVGNVVGRSRLCILVATEQAIRLILGTGARFIGS